MADTRGVFSLKLVNKVISRDGWVNLADVWISPSPAGYVSNTGYFAGGLFFPSPSLYYSTMDKISYTTDTTSPAPSSANLSAARYQFAATGNSTAGYFGGGSAPGLLSTMDKLTYSTDTTVYTPGANLSVARQSVAATGNSTAGYFGGGFPAVSRMDKLTYSTDTTEFTPGANLSSSRDGPAATGNSTNGYFGGGRTTTSPTSVRVSTMDKLTYATDTTAYTPTANLSASRYLLAAAGNSTAGYFSGGQLAQVSTVDKLTYATDLTAYTPSANLSVARSFLAATGNSTAGYFGGGTSGSELSRMDKLNYATDTTAFTPGANLSVPRQGVAASSSKANAVPGLYSTPASPAYKFSDGTPGTPPSSSTTPTTTTFSASNAGYFGGGGTPATATMDKLTYSTDTPSPVPSGANLSSARYYLAATGNSTNGYFGGGQSLPVPTTYSRIDKLTYSTDTTVYTPSANLKGNRSGLSATGNSTAGYFAGGAVVSTMDKLIYSIDTTVYIPGSNLTVSRFLIGATGNSTAGYFGGGGAPGPTYYSTMDKLTYSTGTTAYIPGANLSSNNRGRLSATGNSTAGYFGGGNNGGTPGYVSIMDKITYSTDTPSPVPSGANLSAARQDSAATGNSTEGYFGGGNDGGTPGVVSRMDKLTYSTDTTAYTPGANLSISRWGLAATSARANELPQPTYDVPNIV